MLTLRAFRLGLAKRSFPSLLVWSLVASDFEQGQISEVGGQGAWGRQSGQGVKEQGMEQGRDQGAWESAYRSSIGRATAKTQLLVLFSDLPSIAQASAEQPPRRSY